MERKIGTVYSSNTVRGWAFITVTPMERYFAHISEIKTDRMLEIGQTVSFETAPPRKPGQLPCATDVKLVETVGGTL
jgi:cold shock CspA family protein